MKIVQVNSVYGIGSTGKIVQELSRAMSKNNIDNYVACAKKQDGLSNCILLTNWFNMKLNILKTRIFGKHGFYSKSETKKLIVFLEQFKPNIIHLHNIHGHYLNIKLLFNYLSMHPDIKVVWTLHDCWSFTGHCAHFDFIGCKKWKVLCKGCPQLKEYPKSLIFDRSEESFLEKRDLFNSVKNMRIITPSSWLCALLKQSFLKKCEVITIKNGIDLGLFKHIDSIIKTKLGLGDKQIILAVAMGFGERKGFSFYIELAKMLPLDFQIVMVGVNKYQCKSLPKNITPLLKTDSVRELVELYSVADVFVNMTLEDTFPTVNMESVACGTPVVTWDTGGCSEQICKEIGFVVKKYDLMETYKKICYVIEHKKEFDKCRQYAENHFNKDDMIKKYLELYKM